MKKEIFWSLFILMILAPVMAFAQVVLPGTVDGQVDYAQLISQLIANPKAFTAAAIGAIVILVLVQGTKKFGFKFLEPKLQFAIITLLGQIYGVLVTVFVLQDQDISKALVGLFASGGAAAIFNAFKLVFEKPKAA